jgi:ribonucleoside-diphosphate reductase alpha chain
VAETLGKFAETIFKRTYAIHPEETWEECARRVSDFVAGEDHEELRDEFFEVISTRKFIPGGRYLAQSGKEVPQLTNCFLLRVADSREGWAQLLYKHMMALSTGGGVGTFYGDIRPKGTPIKRFGGVASGPINLMRMVNEVARDVMAGGKRRSALWAGLPWNHKDVEEFIHVKNWPTAIRALKEQNFDFPAPLDMTNISVCLDDEFFSKVHKDKDVWDLYYKICKNMLKTGEPGFSVNLGKQAKEVLRNPCTEVVSATDSDCCNLGSINLSKITDMEELKKVTRIAVRFLYLGTHRSWLPHEDFEKIRERDRRIGLGLMGLHEWCIRNGERYEPNGELGKWLSCWSGISDDEARKFSKRVGGVKPVAVRAIAPTGTIGIIAETTTGIEPINCVAYKRRYLDTGSWKVQYLIDPTVQKLIDEGLLKDPDDVEDAIKLARHVERRIRMQAFVQSFVDQSISSTINLPEWGEPGNNNATQFATALLEYLPKLRGITVYPDGARPGQPIVPIKYETAKRNSAEVGEIEENCQGGVCGL